MTRLCIVEGCGQLTTGTRCSAHQRTYVLAKQAKYRGPWPALSRAAIHAYRSEHGDICPGFRIPAHAINPEHWTLDHDLGPLCRSCNSRKGATIDKERKR